MIKNILAAIALALFALLALGCASTPHRVNIYDVRSDADHPPTYGGMSLRSGQIILSESPDVTSYAFMLIPEKFHYFTHGGVVVMEDGEPWVYEINAELITFPIHERLVDNVEGKVMKRRLFEYATPNLYAEILDPPPGVQGEKVAEFVRRHYQKKTAFDVDFRFDEQEKYYCTEFVEFALRAGGSQPMTPGPALEQPSFQIAKKWLGVPPHEAFPAGYFYDEKRMVASMGQFGSRGAAFAYFEGKKELYRRFSKSDQRLGYMFKLRGVGTIELREDVERFMISVAHIFDQVKDAPGWGDPRVSRAVRRYADAYFGPVPD